MAIHGYSWRSMDIREYQWVSMDIHEVPWIHPWISVEIHGLLVHPGISPRAVVNLSVYHELFASRRGFVSKAWQEISGGCSTEIHGDP